MFYFKVQQKLLSQKPKLKTVFEVLIDLNIKSILIFKVAMPKNI